MHGPLNIKFLILSYLKNSPYFILLVVALQPGNSHTTRVDPDSTAPTQNMIL